jgi:hypothetical protein
MSLRFSGKLYLNCKLITDTLMMLKNILRELRNQLSIILGDSKNPREWLTNVAVFLGRPLTQKTGKLENCGLSCQTFSEILRIS